MSDWQQNPYNAPQSFGVGPAAPPPSQKGAGLAIASLVLGGLDLVSWLLPFCGCPMSIIGLVFGIQGLRSSNRGLAIAGIVLNMLGLLLTIVNAGWGVYLYATRQHPLMPHPQP